MLTDAGHDLLPIDRFDLDEEQTLRQVLRRELGHLLRSVAMDPRDHLELAASTEQ